jgi:hypothetical protein
VAVTIAGSNFSGASAVTFNGTAATFAVVSPTEIDTSVPTGASSGPVSVTTPGGTAQSASAFTVVASAPPPPPPPPPPSGGGGGGGTSVPNLAVTITPSATAVAAGGEVNVAVSVANTGGAGTLWSHTVISLPSGAVLLGTPGFSTGSGCTGTQTIDCNTDYIANGAVSRITFAITLANPGAATISVTATADRDADPSDNTAQATIDVAAPQAPFTPPTPSPAPKPTVPPWWKSCPQLNKRYPHGVGRVGAHDKTRGKPVTTFKRNTSLYRLAVRHNRKLDGDRDGIACEKH